MDNLRKILAILLALHLILGGVSPVFAEFQEETEPFQEETNAFQEEEIKQPEETSLPQEENVFQEEEEPFHEEDDSNPEDASLLVAQTEDSQSQPSSQGTTSNGNVGDDTYIDTGNAASNGNIFTAANSNLSGNGDCCASGGIGVVNDSNGDNSSNTGSATVADNNTTDQSNSATVNNGLTGASVSGQNSASSNTGGDSYITTGNASTTGTIITSANTNIDGVSVAEFNILEDHVGDYILDFGAGCVSGCDGFTGLAQNSGNGVNSDNDASINSDTNNTTNQTNDGAVNNDLYLTSDSGNNTASKNTGGDSYITTGDAQVSGNVLTLLNNNLAGNVILGVVNIFGDLIGDIILPESALNAFFCATCGGNTTLVNSGNGDNSDNNASSNQTVIDTINQVNVADIDNNLILTANTGKNSASRNTGGDAYITTGNADVTAQVLNIANNNIIGGNWWLVIINRAGQWIGQIVGAPQGAMFAGSSGTEFAVDENGQITAINSGNGTGSTNDAFVDSTVNNTTNQTNNAEVNNNIYLSANTGKNETNSNTKGDNYITTGDAKVIANLVNFVNNNIVGGKLLVTFVNVFGNWFGDFLTPGTHKENNDAGIGGPPSGDQLTENNNSQQNLSNSSSSGSNNSGSTNTVVVAINNPMTNTVRVLAAATGSFLGAVNSDGANSSMNTAGAKKTTINLAWAIVFIPILFAIYLISKKYLFKYLPRKNSV